jgi:hypothetical protein
MTSNRMFILTKQLVGTRRVLNRDLLRYGHPIPLTEVG